MAEKQFCETCEHQLIPIDAALPEVMVQIGGLYVGKEQMIPGQYYHNRLWVENSSEINFSTLGSGMKHPSPEPFCTHSLLW